MRITGYVNIFDKNMTMENHIKPFGVKNALNNM